MTDKQNMKAIIAISKGMVDAGLEVLEQFTTEPANDEEDDRSDTQLIVAIFTRMWQVHTGEMVAMKQGLGPKNVLAKVERPKLIIPGAH
jgi:hypothetical protein